MTQPTIVTISDPKLARRLGAKDLQPARRDLIASRESDIIFVSGNTALAWPIQRLVLLERAMLFMLNNKPPRKETSAARPTAQARDVSPKRKPMLR